MRKPLPPPDVPGKTEAERMDNAVRRMFGVSKQELAKREAKWKLARAKASSTQRPARPIPKSYPPW